MKLRNSAVAAALSLLALTGCSNGDFIYGKALGDVANLTGVSTGLEEIDTATPEVAVTAAPEGPPLIVGFKEIRVAIPLAGKSGESLTYAAPDGVVLLSMNNGFVTRVIGLGTDMNGSYLPADSAWYTGLSTAAADGATTDRVIEYWEDHRIKRDKFRCKLTSSVREGGGELIDETCKRYFEPENFVNRYWVRADGSSARTAPVLWHRATSADPRSNQERLLKYLARIRDRKLRQVCTPFDTQ